MIEKSNQLYQDLMQELEHCRSKEYSFLIETEYCFHVAEKYRGILRAELAGYEFPSIELEIFFFKVIKPKFVAESEYASLLNFAGSFCPNTGNPSDLPDFWKRQALRLDRFKKEHHSFYEYYVSGQTNLDVVYFTRVDSDRTKNDYDLLAGQLLAKQRYALYANDQLKSLEIKSNNQW
jgi:hypothetical protein